MRRLHESLREMVETETAKRAQLRSANPLLHESIGEDDVPEDQYQCLHCKAFCYLAQITCSCTKAVACLDHFDSLCNCSSSKRTMRIRYSEAQLDEILESIATRAVQPETWRARLDEVLNFARPPLKSLRGLLAEGEKIVFPMPELHDLRAMVDRANAWGRESHGAVYAEEYRSTKKRSTSFRGSRVARSLRAPTSARRSATSCV